MFHQAPSSSASDRGIKKSFIIAIDLGTNRSAIAHTTVDPTDYQTRGKPITFEVVAKGACSFGQDETKVVTILLMVPGEPDRIGTRAVYDAFDREATGGYVFDFKMLLDVKSRALALGNSTVRLKDTMVPVYPLSPGDAPREMPLLEVLTRYLKVAADLGYRQLEEDLTRQGLVADMPPREEVCWVVTVPAIWTDQARILMREAIAAAELVPSTFSNQVRICLEPEGAALTCFSAWKGDKSELRGSTVLIIDLGGGTADITLHTVTDYVRLGDLVTLDELQPPSGGPWGGRCINDRFEQLVMQAYLGPDAWAKYTANAVARLRFLGDDFEPVKCRFSPQCADQVVKLTNLLGACGISINEVAGVDAVNASLPSEQHVRYSARAGGLLMPAALMRHLFEASLAPLRAHLETLFAERGSVDRMFVVGGLGANAYVIDCLQQFATAHGIQEGQFIAPARTASLAIVAGATRFGYDGNAFGLRIARTNYGIRVYNRADPSRPKFDRLIKKGSNLRDVAKATKAKPLGPYSPLTADQTSIMFSLYETDADDVEYVDDPRCAFISEGSLPVTMTVPFDERKFMVSFSMDSNVIEGHVVSLANAEHSLQMKWSSR